MFNQLKKSAQEMSLFFASGMVALTGACDLGDEPPESPEIVVRMPAEVYSRSIQIDGLNIHYRESGDEQNPVLLLLHGFPSSSHMFRDLIPLLSDRYRVIAPDYPGFGFSDSPDRASFDYTFDNIANVMSRLTEELALERYALYVFDYGAPVGFRMAAAHPERVSAIVSQNGNAYEEGLNPEVLAGAFAYWDDPSEENRNALRPSFAPDSVIWQYTTGVSDLNVLLPDGYTHDNALLARPGNDEIQLDLLLDYQTNVELYPEWQAYFREQQPPTLAVWGEHDPFFLPAGAEAFLRDLPETELHFLDTGHFALETHHNEIAGLIRDFLAKHD